MPLVTFGFVRDLVEFLKHDPGRACDQLGALVLALKRAEPNRSLAFLVEELSQEEDLLLEMEHCLIKQTRPTRKYTEAYACIRPVEYIRHFLAFLQLWVELKEDSMEGLFHERILVRTVAELCSHEACGFPDIAFNLATLLGRYLDNECTDVAQWFGTDVGMRQMETIGKAFCQVCFDSKQSRLLLVFLEIVSKCDYGTHQKMMLYGVYKAWMLGVEDQIKQRIEDLEYKTCREWFHQQLLEAKCCSMGFDLQLKAAAFAMVVGRLVEEEQEERCEYPPIKEVILRAVLLKHKFRQDMHSIVMEDILGCPEVTTPYEYIRHACTQNGDAWKDYELGPTHKVFEIIADLTQQFQDDLYPDNTQSTLLPLTNQSYDTREPEPSNDSMIISGVEEMPILYYTMRTFYEKEMEHIFGCYLDVVHNQSIDWTPFDPTMSDSENTSNSYASN